MTWLLAVLRARWFPYAAIGVAALATGAFGYGYLKGYDTAEDHYLKEMNRAMKAQYDQLQKVHKKDITAVVREAERSRNVRNSIEALRTLPDNCALPPECLQHFNDGVFATGTHPSGVDE